ncbi:MAG TPA: PASTA domain-containing protein [Pyrinomonadaceae bacterium]
MSFIKKSTSALGKLFVVVLLAAAFLVGMVSVVYLSLQGSEIKVPEIVGKDFNESEKTLTDLGLRIKKRADRYSEEKPNTILEQLPRPGDTVKTGQMILVVTSKANPEGEETPATIKKTTDEDDTEKIEELISDKPKKKTNSNTNTNKKKSSTTRDVLSNNSNSNSNSSNSNSNSSETNKSTNSSNKSTNPTDTKKPGETTKPAANKTPNGGDTRPRKNP